MYRKFIDVVYWKCMYSTSTGIRVTRYSAHQDNKNIILLRPAALLRVQELYDSHKSNEKISENKLLKIGLKTKGCSGSSYMMDFVSEKGKFDELVEQNGVKVIVDSKALLSIIGSEIDYVQDKLSSEFVFYNPNVKETCGCGQSFLIQSEDHSPKESNDNSCGNK